MGRGAGYSPARPGSGQPAVPRQTAAAARPASSSEVQPPLPQSRFAPNGAYRGAGFIGQDRRRGRGHTRANANTQAGTYAPSDSGAYGQASATDRRGLVMESPGSAKKGPTRRARRRDLLSNVLIVVGVVLLLVAGGMFGMAQFQYHQQDKTNAALAQYVTVSDDPQQQLAQGPQVDWEGLKAVNPDVVGWVQVPGTPINYPVYQGKDNNEYLRTNAMGEWSVGGQIFMDYENQKPGMVDPQTVIYGHHLNNGEMFASVDAMADQQKFDEATTVWYVTEQATYELEPLYFYRTPATNGDARKIDFASADELHTYLAGYLSEAVTKSSKADEAVNKVTKVLTLGTCDYDNPFGQGNGRGLVVCALKSEVENS